MTFPPSCHLASLPLHGGVWASNLALLSSLPALRELKAQNLLRDSPRPTRKVVRFDAQCVQLLVFTSSGLLSLQKFEWTAPGSFVVLLDFLHTPPTAEPDWLCVLRSACAHFRVTLAPTNAFLGHGATGRVFRVLKPSTRGEEEDEEAEAKSAGAAVASRAYALKVVEGGKQGEHITCRRKIHDSIGWPSSTVACWTVCVQVRSVPSPLGVCSRGVNAIWH